MTRRRTGDKLEVRHRAGVRRVKLREELLNLRSLHPIRHRSLDGSDEVRKCNNPSTSVVNLLELLLERLDLLPRQVIGNHLERELPELVRLAETVHVANQCLRENRRVSVVMLCLLLVPVLHNPGVAQRILRGEARRGVLRQQLPDQVLRPAVNCRSKAKIRWDRKKEGGEAGDMPAR